MGYTFLGKYRPLINPTTIKPVIYVQTGLKLQTRHKKLTQKINLDNKTCFGYPDK